MWCTLCPPKKWAPKHFATATSNLHEFKWNFTHTRRHLFLSSKPNFIRIPYSIYEIFNSLELLLLLSQISVTDTASHSFSLWWLPSSRAVPQPTVPVRWLCYCQLRHPTSSAHWTGHRTVQISIRWTMRFGTFCRNGSTAARSVTSTIWKNDWLKNKSGVVLITTLLTEQWINGVIDCIKCVRVSDLNILTVLTDINCAGNSWPVGNVI